MEKLLGCRFRNKAINRIVLSTTNLIAYYSMIKSSTGYISISKELLPMYMKQLYKHRKKILNIFNSITSINTN